MNWWTKFKNVMSGYSPAQGFIEEHGRISVELDNRVNEVTKATINGEESWFLKLVRKDPDCAVEVIKECDLDNGIGD